MLETWINRKKAIQETIKQIIVCSDLFSKKKLKALNNDNNINKERPVIKKRFNVFIIIIFSLVTLQGFDPWELYPDSTK